METCENCHRQIGDLETPCVLNDHVVCRECWERLNHNPAGRPVLAREIAENQGVMRPLIPPGQVLCPYCGYIGNPIMVRKPKATDGFFVFGNIFLMIFLAPLMWLTDAATNQFAPACPICKNWLPRGRHHKTKFRVIDVMVITISALPFFSVLVMILVMILWAVGRLLTGG